MSNKKVSDCTDLPERQRLKVFKNHKAYDRVRDRKNKRLYEVDVEDGSYEESQIVFQSS